MCQFIFFSLVVGRNASSTLCLIKSQTKNKEVASTPKENTRQLINLLRCLQIAELHR